MKKLITLFSGGIDSTTLLYFLKSEGYKITTFTANFGQTAQKDLEYAAVIVKRLNIPWIQVAFQTETGIPKPVEDYKLKFTPNRNATLLSMAAGFAKTLKYDGIAYGAHHTDFDQFPDCRPEFVDKFRELTKCALDDPRFQIVTPFIYMEKSEIIKVGSKLGVPFELTRSCYENEDIHCGICRACITRKRAFIKAGIEDPTVYRR